MPSLAVSNKLHFKERPNQFSGLQDLNELLLRSQASSGRTDRHYSTVLNKKLSKTNVT